MIFSTIDIGTNTILMVTARVDASGSISILGDEHAIARLGKGVDASRTIPPESIDRVAGFLERYRSIATSLGAERIAAFGTSALRDASNRDEVIEELDRRTGVRIEVIEGGLEAELTYRGALYGLSPATGPHAVLDIGGGSTEIALGDGQRITDSVSLDIGAVRITERYLTTLPPTERHVVAAREEARSALTATFELPADVTVVGVAGTVTTLGAIDAGIERFDADELNGRRLSADTIATLVDRLSRLSLAEIAAIPQVSEGRADIILGGALILDEFMRRHAISELVVSTRGVRYGMMLHELERMKTAGLL